MDGRHADELRAALKALEVVIALRLEERRCRAVHDADPGRRAEALLSRPLGLTGSEGLPALSAFAGTGPVAQVVSSCALTAAEALLLVAALAPEVDEKFAVYYGLLTDRATAGGHLTGEIARTLCARTFAGRLAAADLLHPEAPLRRLRLLDLDRCDDGPLAGRVRPDGDLVAIATGRTRVGAQHSAEFPATPLQTVHTLDDVVVAADIRTRLRSLVSRIQHRDRVLDAWGFAAHHDNVRGTLVLFHGPPGTGKTMTAAALAREVGLPAFRVDLSALVSKYIGETEKNLARVFARAESDGSLLLFDEADAVFGRRTEVGDAHDRYANQEVSYLLQRIESHPGVVILATNLLGNLDDAFARRIDLRVEFPPPARPERDRLWRKVMPAALPVSAGLDLATVAERYTLTGAEIRDATLGAAYLAAADGGVVTQEHLLSGVRDVFVRSGRTMPGQAGG